MSILINRTSIRLFGATAVPVYGVLWYADGFVRPIMHGSRDSFRPAVGYNRGYGKYPRVRAVEKCRFTADGVFLLAVMVTALPPRRLRSYL